MQFLSPSSGVGLAVLSVISLVCHQAEEHFFFLILFYFLTLQYCIGFAIYQNERGELLKKDTGLAGADWKR